MSKLKKKVIKPKILNTILLLRMYMDLYSPFPYLELQKLYPKEKNIQPHKLMKIFFYPFKLQA